jgi:hypothetical protein
MDLVEINSLRPQTAQAIFTLAQNGVCLEDFVNFPAAIAAESAFGEHVRPSARPLGECSGDDFFGVAQSVGGGRIDPVNSQLHCAVDCDDRFLIVLQPNCQPEPPMAHAPKPTGVIDMSELPSFFVSILFVLIYQVYIR